MTTIKAIREQILDPLQSVIGIVERRHTLPILSNVLFQVTPNGIDLVATDLEVQVRTQAHIPDAPVAAHGESFTLSARKFFEILRSLPSDARLEMELREEGRLQIRSGKSRFNMQTLPGQDFPMVAINHQPGTVVTISQKVLKELFERVQYAMAQQDVRYYLNGALLSIQDDLLILVATDGHRLGYASEVLPERFERTEMILPRKTVSELIKLLSPVDEPVRITLRDNQVEFAFGAIELLSKVIDGKFPDYSRVIPNSYVQHVQLKREALLAALQRAAILSNDKIHGVRLLLTRDNLAVVCTNNENEEAREDMEVEYPHSPLDIGFNLSYLLDVLSHLSSENITASFGDANSSVLITAPETRDHFKYVVMPMRI